MGRLLITFILCYEGVLRRPLLYLSHFFKVQRFDYYRYLQKIRDEGDWEAWLKFFLRGVHEVAQEATVTVRNIVQLREMQRNSISTYFTRSAGPAYHLLEFLYKRPVVTVQNVGEVTGLSYANANSLVAKFMKNGILVQMDTYRRNRRFVYSQYLSLFASEDVPGGKSKPIEAKVEAEE